MEPWTALLVGLGGSVHCVGMCGPLALALAGGQDRRARFLAGRLLYNGGRILTYAGLGGLFGVLGGAIELAGLQQGLSVALGVLIIVAALLGQLHRRLPVAPPLTTAVAWLKGALARLLRLESAPGLLLVGILNGLLPCGFVYLALAGSLTTGGALEGMAYMALFGVGTVPLMLATSLTGRLLLRHDLQAFARRALPVGMYLLGALFVLRGLGLGIRFVSPVLGAAGGGHGH